jgi:multiple sugar transport system substrate-binding protein/arabinogalactan oligomer/maltooligosaccharide transport system substrate-binding protein
VKIKLLLLSVLVITSMILAAACAPAPATEKPATGQATEAPAVTEAPSTQAPSTETAAGEKTLTVWGFVWTADWLDAIAPAFEAQHPGVKVKVERFEYDPYQEMVLTTLASGQGVPDVVTLDPMWAGDLIRGGTVLPLDKATTELNVADFVPAGWNLYSWKGVQYGIPLDLDFQLVFYRKDVYDKAMATLGMTEFPTTIDDYRALAKEVTKETGKPALLLSQGDYYSWYQSFLAPMGGNLINDEGTQYVFNDQKSVDALQLYSDLANVDKTAKLWSSDVDGDPMVALKGGDVMAILNGSWFATEIASGAPEMKGQWAIAPVPFGPEGRPNDAATGGACLSIPTQAKEPELAWEFIKYTMTPENQAEYFRVVAGVPSLKTSWTDPALDEVNDFFGVPIGRSVADWSLRAAPMQLPSLEVADLIGEAITKATTGEAAPQEALDEAVNSAPPLE